MTLKDLLTMTSGIRWDETTVDYTDPANSCARMEASKDWIQFVLDQPMAAEPGSTFVYSSGVTELLAEVLRKATGKQADAYAAEHLFGPLGISRFYWKKTPTGHPDTEGGLYLTARDLAKIGYLYMKDGVWEGRRILPEGWAAASTRRQSDPTGEDASMKYGYQWWVLPGKTPLLRRHRLRRPAAGRRAVSRARRRLHRLEHLRQAGADGGVRPGSRARGDPGALTLPRG